MNILTKDTDLIKFIKEKKSFDQDIDHKKLYYYYSKVVRLAYIKTYMRINNLKYSKICADIIDNIFWIIFNFTFNIKLTMFLSERAYIMFSEFLYISKEDNIIDAKIFVYEKTIGLITINEFKTRKGNGNIINKLKNISSHCENINLFYNHILKITLNDEEKYNEISNYFENTIGIFNLFPDVKIFYKVLFEIITNLNKPILVKINLLFIISHIFYIKKRSCDDLNKINKYCNNYDLSEINKIFKEQLDIEFTDSYDYIYNCFN